MTMTGLFLCGDRDLGKERASYARAFARKNVQIVCVEEHFPLDGEIRFLLERCAERPSLIVHPELSAPYLPWGLTETDIPTVCLHIDTYAYTHRRIAWSMLFDIVLVFHPGYDEKFREAGHPGACFIPHAVEVEDFSGEERERVFDLGWVGQSQGPLYRTRERILPALSHSFRMNDWKKRYSREDMAEIYRRSKIVVNIGRDDYPQDANLRVFEAMAGGALLITVLPSELPQIGFQDGVHFLGYRNEQEIEPLVRKYLTDEPGRRSIADAGREKVLREHTYDRTVETLLQQVERHSGKLLAPARSWSESRVRMAYLDYFAAHGELGIAVRELRRIVRLSAGDAVRGASLLVRAWARKVRSRIAVDGM
jgi:hypothetical protein